MTGINIVDQMYSFVEVVTEMSHDISVTTPLYAPSPMCVVSKLAAILPAL